ncbi:MAG: glucokinase [Leptospiraceae bacterium]|nr:MAG: glucokinase [Leptospiraceae bacterium]
MENQNIAIIGMDLGGSNLFSVAYDKELKEILYQEKIDTEARKGYKYVISKIASQIIKFQNLLKEKNYSIFSIGLGIPGTVDVSKGMVYMAPNLGWNHVSLLEDLELDKDLKSRICLINDVNAGLYGELISMEKIPEIAVAFFCGTGIGGAIAINGQLITGINGSAGEVGHMIVKKKGKRCLCGRKGCLEAYIGKWALNVKIQRNIIKNEKTLLKKIIKYDLSKTPIKSSSLKKAYLEGDSYTRKLLEKYYCSYLGAGISQVINFINPEVIVLGGGIMEALGEYLLPYIYKYVEKFSITRPPKFYLAQLGDYAGPIGSAYYSYNYFIKQE